MFKDRVEHLLEGVAAARSSDVVHDHMFATDALERIKFCAY